MVTNGKPIDIYARQSSPNDPSYMGSPESQADICTGFLNAFHMDIGISVTDIGTGTKWNRKELNRLIERIRNGESGGICVAYQSRFARDADKSWQVTQEIQNLGGVVIGPGVADYSTPEGKKSYKTQAVDDEYYSDRARENTHNARIRAIKNGRHFGRWIPIGYDRINGQLIPNDDAPAIREAFKLRASGKGPQQIVDALKPYNIKTSHGQELTRTSVWQLLHNSVYTGELTYKQNGEIVVSKSDAHEAIVDPVLFQAAQRKGIKPQATGKYPNSCVGILKCDVCKLTLTATQNGRGVRFYRCSKCRPKLHVAASVIEPLMESTFTHFIEDIRVQEFDTPPETQEVEDKYNSASMAYGQLFNDTELRELDYSHWREALTTAKDKRDSLAAEYNQAKSLAQEITDNPIFDERLYDYWHTYTAAQKNELYRWAFDEVRIRRIGDGRRKPLEFDIDFSDAAMYFLRH